MILFKWFEVKTPNIIPVFGFEIPIPDPQSFMNILWVLFIYFSYRLYVHWVRAERKIYRNSLMTYVYKPFIEVIVKSTGSQFSHLKIDNSKLKESLRLYFLDRGRRFRTDYRGVIPIVPGNPGDDEFLNLKRGWMNKNIWFSYMKLQMINLFEGKYISEIGIPIFLVGTVIVYVGIPSLLEWWGGC